MKQGTDRQTGTLIGGLDYLRQRMTDALETEQGSLVVERQYGSRLHELVDMNVDLKFEMECYVRVAECIANPKNGLDDFRLTDMKLVSSLDGQIELDLYGLLLDNGEPIVLEGILLDVTRDKS